MDDETLGTLSTELSDPRAGVRLRALDRITVKSGRGIVRRLDDDRCVGLLTDALADPDRRVRRAAARGLRPWVLERPGLLDEVLPHYTASSFDGSYTHLGLYDTRDGAVHIPRFAALKGHAALLRDGNTDRYFKFDFYVPGQAPRRFIEPDAVAAGDDGHLVLHYILDWSYARQTLVPAFDERRRAAALAEQDRYAAAVVRFYEGCALPYDVRVHHLTMTSGARPRLERDAARIAGRA
jgi:hypothetical protein